MYELEDNILKLKKKVFYLIHDSKNGLTVEKIIQLVDSAKNDLEKILKDLESEAMIYLNEVDKYISYFNEDYNQRLKKKLQKEEKKKKKKKEKEKNAEVSIKSISKNTGLTENEILNLVKDKKEQLKNLINDEGALFIISKELGTEPTKIRNKESKRIRKQMLHGYPQWNPSKQLFSDSSHFLSSEDPPPLNTMSKENKLTTGSASLDALLGGGLKPGFVYEIFGDSRAGKTSLAYQLSVNVQLSPDKGGLKGKAFYIECCGGFEPERISELASYSDLEDHNYQEVLKNVLYERSGNPEAFGFYIEKAEKLIKESNLKLFFVDNLSCLGGFYISNKKDNQGFDIDYTPQNPEGHFYANSLFRKILSDLHQLAQKYSIIVVFTYNLDILTRQKLGDPFKPIGSTVFSQEHHTRIFFARKSYYGNTHIAHLLHSPDNLPKGRVEFYIGDKGIE